MQIYQKKITCATVSIKIKIFSSHSELFKTWAPLPKLQTLNTVWYLALNFNV